MQSGRMLLRLVNFFRNHLVSIVMIGTHYSKYRTRYGRHNSKNKVQAAGTISYVVIYEQRISVAENIHTDRMNSQELSAY